MMYMVKQWKTYEMKLMYILWVTKKTTRNGHQNQAMCHKNISKWFSCDA